MYCSPGPVKTSIELPGDFKNYEVSCLQNDSYDRISGSYNDWETIFPTWKQNFKREDQEK